jgi:hypothetical protein
LPGFSCLGVKPCGGQPASDELAAMASGASLTGRGWA